MRRPIIVLAALLSACAALAPAATPAPPASPPTALAPPCDPPLEIPPGLIAAIRAQFEEGRSGPPAPLPAADIATYQKNQAEQKTRDWADLCRFRPANFELMKQKADPKRVVFMGDSITENWGLAHPDFFAADFVNRGISGQTTPQMLLRFRADVVALHPAVVHILAGINDIAGNTGASTLSAIEDNIASMAEIAKVNGVKVVLTSTLPADKFNWAPKLQPAGEVRALNAWLKSYAASHGLAYADYYTPMATEAGGMKPELTLDGVHPNNKGYDVMEPVTRAAIAAALKR